MEKFNVKDLTTEQVWEVINERVEIFHDLEDCKIMADKSGLDEDDLGEIEENLEVEGYESIKTSIEQWKVILLIENY